MESPKITTKIIHDILSEANMANKNGQKSISKAFYRTEIYVEINRRITMSIVYFFPSTYYDKIRNKNGKCYYLELIHDGY